VDLDLVAVGRFADVPALVGVGDQAVPGQLEHVDDVPLGDGLLDPAGQDRGGPSPPWPNAQPRHGIRGDAFVGDQQGDAGLLELVFDLGAEVGDPRQPVDRFADDRDEPPVRAGGLG